MFRRLFVVLRQFGLVRSFSILPKYEASTSRAVVFYATGSHKTNLLSTMSVAEGWSRPADVAPGYLCQ